MVKSIEQLWYEVVDGDPRAWTELLARYESLVISVARRAGLSRADAEDCSQQVWLTLYRNVDQINDPLRLGAWLARSTHRNAIRYLKKLTSHAKLLQTHSPTVSESLPDAVVAQLERQAHFDYALRHLDDRCRRLLQALFYSPENLSYQAIADRLGIPPNSLGPTRSRCLIKLKKILKDLGYY